MEARSAHQNPGSGNAGRNGHEAQRIRRVQLSILLVETVSVIAVIPSAISLSWREVWLLPPLVLGTVICWVLHIRNLLPVRTRTWVFAVMAWMVVMFDGAHASSLFDIAVVAALEMALFSQTDERGLLHASIGVYLFLLICQLAAIARGDSVALNSLVVSQILMHAAIVFITYRVALNIISQREADRRHDERIIRELTYTRQRTENFMANVSHELRTPVNVVTGLSSVMETRLPAGEDREDAAHILEAGRRLSDQVDDILDFTEIETGRFTFTEEPYEITSVVNDAVASLNLEARGYLPDLIVDLDARIPRRLAGDARRIKKVLSHLMDNAIKFTKTGGVYVNVYQMPQRYGVNLCLDVRDTGIGMSGEVLERVREGIYQEDAERNRENTGFGLGLRIVYGIVHAMDGFVRIESVPGQGTRVHVTIPQRIADAAPCLTVADPEKIRIAFYQRQNKFQPPLVSAYYMRMIGYVIESFSLVVQRVSTLADLKEMIAAQSFTHLYIANDEYEEEPAYFDALCETMQVVMVERAPVRLTPFSRVTILKKPFSTQALAATLNAETEQDAKAALSGGGAVRFDGLHVLAVDDEEMNLVVARGIFADYGMETAFAHSGQESIDLVRKNDYDVIFMDHMMPGMDGVEAAHRIRDVLKTQGKKSVIVALTANAVSGAREMFMAEGFDGFVAKPIERKELERALLKAFPSRGGVRREEQTG